MSIHHRCTAVGPVDRVSKMHRDVSHIQRSPCAFAYLLDFVFLSGVNYHSLSNAGGPRGDRDSSSSVASLLFPVNAERAGEAAANDIEDTVASAESVRLTTPYSTTSVGAGSGDNLAPHEAERKRYLERARDIPDASGGTTGRWDNRTVVPFPSPTRQTHFFTAPQDPMDSIDEEEPEEIRAL